MKKINSKFNITIKGSKNVTGSRLTVIYSIGKIYDIINFDPICLTEGLDLLIEYDTEKQQYKIKIKYANLYTIESCISSLIFDQEIRNEIDYLIKKINRQLSNPMLFINNESLNLEKFRKTFRCISKVNKHYTETSFKETSQNTTNHVSI